MASNDEGQGSGDCDGVYWAADEFLSLADETEIGAETETGIETGAQTETGAETSGAGVEPKAKRLRLPNKLKTTRLMVTEDEDDDGTQQYVYTGAYSGFERHELVPELPSPEAEYYGRPSANKEV